MSDLHSLTCEHVSKRFGGFYALKNVSLSVRQGSIHGLIGPNGAGKSTLFNILTKFLKPTSGTIRLNGRDITAMEASDVANLGLVRSFQISAIFNSFSVLENVKVALLRQRGLNLDFWSSDRKLSSYDEQAMRLLSEVGLSDYADEVAGALPYGRKRALELATTLAMDPRVMLLDEPTAGMPHDEVDRIVRLIQSIRADRTIILVEHNLSVVEGLCDTITVLARGEILAEGTYRQIAKDPVVAAAYLGTDE